MLVIRNKEIRWSRIVDGRLSAGIVATRAHLLGSRGVHDDSEEL